MNCGDNTKCERKKNMPKQIQFKQQRIEEKYAKSHLTYQVVNALDLLNN